MKISVYEEDWNIFRKYIEDKAKGRCLITNKNWLKLRDFHFEGFIKKVPQPYSFLFKMIYMSTIHKEIPSIHRIYYKYGEMKRKELQTTYGLKTRVSKYTKERKG